MQFHPLFHEPGLTPLQGSRGDDAARDINDSAVVAGPRMDVGRAVITDVHVDHNAVEGAQTRHEAGSSRHKDAAPARPPRPPPITWYMGDPMATWYW